MKNKIKKDLIYGNVEFSYQEEEKGHAHDRIIFSLGRSWHTIVLMITENMYSNISAIHHKQDASSLAQKR